MSVCPAEPSLRNRLDYEESTESKSVHVCFLCLNVTDIPSSILHVGLYESILEQKTFSATALKAIAIHLEQNPAGQILVHCTLGKDQTGMVAMLCLSLCGYSDEYICEDFEKLNCIYNRAIAKFEHFLQGRVETSRFTPSRKEVMRGTLAYIRTSYGTVSRYLLEAGFDSMWQDRLQKALSE